MRPLFPFFGKGSPTFRHGVHPREWKELTNRLPIERMPFVNEYVLPLSQHLGSPSVALVEPGQRVERGQLIGRPGGFVSTALHAPVTGTVKAIELRPHPSGQRLMAIVLETDPYASQQMVVDRPPAPAELSTDELARRVQEAGLVGMGGAAFPSHVKLKVPEGKRVRYAILNGCECEPYLTCDHRLMLERPHEVLRGLELIRRQLGAESAFIGVELNKPDAIEALRAAARERADASPGQAPPVEIVPLEVKYPQGAEKMLIDAVFHREVKAGGLPIDIEMVVHNVATAVALTDLFDTGQPLIERVVTVTGPGVRRPANLLVPLGTKVADVLEYCGGLRPETRQVILGGPMMGTAQKSLEIPVTKGTSGILALTSRARLGVEEEPCIRCGRCLEACAMFLNPSRLAQLVRAEAVEELEAMHVTDCFECASCSFVCPSHLPLVQLMRMGKAMVRQAKQKAAA
jgi:Na+-translocating ferredoxin:NAD+ oxidoreductase subunit C